MDGKARDARLQHPLGVAWNEHDKMVYVADSYNHKVRLEVCGRCGGVCVGRCVGRGVSVEVYGGGVCSVMFAQCVL